MAFITRQKQGDGKYTTIYVTEARWGDLKGGRRGAVQTRLYAGRLNRGEQTVRLSRGMTGTADVRVPLAELERRGYDMASLRFTVRLNPPQEANP